MKSYKINKYNKRSKNNRKNKKTNKQTKNLRNLKKIHTRRRKNNVMKTRKIKGGVGESFVSHFSHFARMKQEDREKNIKRRQEEMRILEEEKFNDEKQKKLDKFITTFKNDECSICLENLDEDKNKTNMEKCLSCLDKKNKKLYFTDCEHTFHGRCLDKWLEENDHCPLCREYIQHMQYASEYPIQ